VLEAAGVPAAKVPPSVRAGEVVGELTGERRAQLGLEPGSRSSPGSSTRGRASTARA
jgi:sugar (pentulose or hexulose) kinase